MNRGHSNSQEYLRGILSKVPAVKAVKAVNLRHNIIDYILAEHKSLGELTIKRLKEEDAGLLFDFYSQGLSDKSRNLFCPYPLFSNPAANSQEELADRIREWEKEDDWIFWNLIKGKEIIGVGLLKKYKRNNPTSGLAVRDDFHRMGLGFLIQTVINEQARLLGLDKVISGVAQDNIASLQLHKRCGFKETGKLVPHIVNKNGVEAIERYDIDLILCLNPD